MKIVEIAQTLAELLDTLKLANALSDKDVKGNSLMPRLYIYEKGVSVVLFY